MNVADVIKRIPSMDQKERQTLRNNALRWLDREPSKAAAAKQVLEALDAAEGQERENLYHYLVRLDAVSRIVEVFRRKPMSESERLIVQVLLDNPGCPSEELTWKAGWKGQSSWHLRFGIMCRDREHLLWPAPFDGGRDAEFYCGILANIEGPYNRFTMKPEAVEAFKRLGLVAREKR